jgi:hypothetical protein
MRTSVVAAGAIVVAAAAAVPYISCRVLEDELRAAVDGYNKRQTTFAASIASYDRRWLRSEFVARFAVRGGPEVARATTRVRHAPFTGLSFATGESEVHLPDTHAATEQYYFEGQVPVAIAFDVAYGGGASGVLRSAAVDKAVIGSPKARIAVAPSSASFAIGKDGQFRADWTFPRIAVSDGSLRIEAEGLAFKGRGQLGDDDLTKPSGFTVSLASYRATHAAGAATLRDVALSSQLVPTGDTVRIAAALRTGAGEFAAKGRPHAWDSLDFACSLNDLPKAPMIRYSSEVRRIADGDVPDAQRIGLAMRALSGLTAGLAEGEPVFAIDKLDLRTPHGAFSASLRASVNKARGSIDAASWSLAEGIVVTGRVAASRALAVRTIDTILGAPGMAEDTLRQLVARGVVKESGDMLELDVAGRDGIFMVNGVRASELGRM